MKAIVTICSRHKSGNQELLPAHKRYTGAHIKRVEKISKELTLPFFILSGKYGLISADEKIPNYDYYLETDATDALVKVVEAQLKKHGITEINFYTEGEEKWAPYEIVLRKTASLVGVILRVHQL